MKTLIERVKSREPEVTRFLEAVAQRMIDLKISKLTVELVDGKLKVEMDGRDAMKKPEEKP